MSSAIELYKEAYDLDFKKGDRSFAEVLYKEIIERFPYSDEKEYALVHLERIAKLKGDPDDPAYRAQGTGEGGGLAVVCFVLILLILTALGFAGWYGYRLHLRTKSNESVVHGLISRIDGDNSGAEQEFELARRTDPRNGLAYRCLAELYLQSGRREQAELVGRQWELQKPYDIELQRVKSRFSAPSDTGNGHERR